MTYNTIARRIVDRSINNAKTGTRFAEMWVKTPAIDPHLLAAHIQRRSPRSKVMADLTNPNQLRIVVYTEFLNR